MDGLSTGSGQAVVTIFVSASLRGQRPCRASRRHQILSMRRIQGRRHTLLRPGRPPFDKLRAGLGSTSVTVAANGAKFAEMRYTAWGEVRYQSGATSTDRTYTGQRSYASDFGLMFYTCSLVRQLAGPFCPGRQHRCQSHKLLMGARPDPRPTRVILLTLRIDCFTLRRAVRIPGFDDVGYALS